MQKIRLDQTDRKILDLLQSEPGINASHIGERIGLSQSAVWRRIQGLREEGIVREPRALEHDAEYTAAINVATLRAAAGQG